MHCEDKLARWSSASPDDLIFIREFRQQRSINFSLNATAEGSSLVIGFLRFDCIEMYSLEASGILIRISTISYFMSN